jgi:hypothetical protein
MQLMGSSLPADKLALLGLGAPQTHQLDDAAAVRRKFAS